ncbi:MAG: Hint domain-containing protein [bacterium]
MTLSVFRWCDTSGHWHDGYPDSSCHYTHVETCDNWGHWHDCTPKLDGYVDGTAGNDLIDYNYTGDPQGDKIDHSDAVLSGAAPNDDYVRAGAGNDTVLAGLGNDRVYGGDGNDSLNGQDGNDTLYGENGNDTLIGGAGNNAEYGGAGNDVFVGGSGSDTFYGGTDQDNIDYSSSGAAVQVNLTTGVLTGGDAANDHIGNGIDGVIGSAYGDSLTGFDQQGTDAGDIYTNQFFGGGGNDTISAMGGADLVYGGADQDLVYGGTGNDTLHGDAGNDTVFGGAGRDLVYGGDGNDVIDSSTGNLADQHPDIGYPGLYPADSDVNDDKDSVYGGAGDDTIRTGDDADSIYGGTGNDSIDAGVDNDTVFGDDGNDTIIGGEGSDNIDGGNGNDLIYGGYGPGVPDAVNIPDATDLAPGNGRDFIHGGEGNDTIFGMDDRDTIYGDAGNDSIDGGIDNDEAYGGAGNDTITGGEGSDTLYGGDDRDMFVGNTAGDYVDGNEGGNDYDTLDLTGAGPLHINYDPLNHENGVVNFLDPTDHHVTGTLTFKNIENVIPCFTPGTLIATPRGEVAVEDLRAGDKIITRDNGMQEIRWMGRRDLSWTDLASAPHLKPVLIRQGALGNGLPERDMLVSPNHRLLVANDRTALYFDEHEVLVAAKHLAAGKGIHSVDAAGTSYIHFMCDRHEVVLSNGAWTESFQPGDMTLKGMGNAQRSEIYDLFPDLKTDAGVESYTAARRTLKRHEALLIAK